MIKKALILFLSIMLLITIFCISYKSHNITFYVATNGNDAFSGTISSPNILGTNGPFKTIGKAKETVRIKREQGFKYDIYVQIRKGEYSLASTLKFDHRDSSISGKTIFENYKNEKVTIYGGEKISSWGKFTDNIYVTHVEDTDIGCIYENGIRGITARYPNETYSKTSNMILGYSKSQFGFEGNIPHENDLNNLEVGIWPGGLNGDWNWFFNVIKIKNIDFSNKQITLDNDAALDIGKGSRYFIQNSLELLNTAGEFYFDKKNKNLYYFPRNYPIEKQSIIIPKLTRLVDIQDTGKNYAYNIGFKGINFTDSNFLDTDTNDALVYIGNNTRNISVKNCNLFNSGSNGISIIGDSQNTIVYGDKIYCTGYNGIQLNGSNGIDDINKYNFIENNYIHNVGQILGDGMGISILNSGDNLISHNTIYNCPRNGISVLGDGDIIGKNIDNIIVTKDNYKDFAHSRNNKIQFNDISHCIEDSEDAGLIGFWGTGDGNIVNNNYLHDSDVPFAFACGIYIDDGSNNITVTKNVLTRLQKKNNSGHLIAAFYVKGVNNKIINNIAIDNQEGSSGIYSLEMDGEPNNSLIIKNNIFFNSGDILYNFGNWNENRFKSADYNLIYNSSNKYYISGVPLATNFNQWRSLFNSKYDKHSIIQEPKFTDVENGKYNLKERILGIGNVDISGVGAN